MQPEIYGFIGTLIGTVIGTSASIATTYMNSRYVLLQQTKAEEIQRSERSRAFQRDTLIKIQETLQAEIRNVGEMNYQDTVAYRETGKWQKSPLGEELNKKILITNRELSILTERISNDELRKNIKEFRNLLSNCSFTASIDEGNFNLKQAVDNFTPLMEHIGKVLRDNY